MNTITLIVICAFGFILTSTIAKLTLAIAKNVHQGQTPAQRKVPN
jgi:hypothetical protein